MAQTPNRYELKWSETLIMQVHPAIKNKLFTDEVAEQVPIEARGDQKGLVGYPRVFVF